VAGGPKAAIFVAAVANAAVWLFFQRSLLDVLPLIGPRPLPTSPDQVGCNVVAFVQLHPASLPLPHLKAAIHNVVAAIVIICLCAPGVTAAVEGVLFEDAEAAIGVW
jgi:hypothetical protein